MTPAILGRLRGVRRSGKGWIAYCPAHDDRAHRSLSVSIGDDGRTLVHCFAKGCSAEQVARAVDMTLSDLGPPTDNNHRDLNREVAIYDYTDERGQLLYQVVRFEPKDFRPRRPDGRGGWVWNLDGVRRVVYRLTELAEAERVYHVEGEKDADRLVDLGLRATTTAGGAQSWRDNYADQVQAAGVQEVVLFADNDPAGARYAVQAARAYLARLLRVKIVSLPVAEKGDVSDYLDSGATRDSLTALIDATPWLVEPPDLPEESAPVGPRIALEGDEGSFTWTSEGVDIRMVGARESSDSLHAECYVCLKGEDVHWARLNLASTGEREKVVKKLEGLDRSIAWREHLEIACRRTAEHVRIGEPLVALVPAPRPPGQRDLIADVLPLGETSLIYADGDSGKGILALLMALVCLTGCTVPHLRPLRRVRRVAYLDWETTEEEIAARVDALCRGLKVTLPPGAMLYRPMIRALADDTPRLRAEFERQGVELVVVDSLVPACGAEPEGAHATITTFNALRAFASTTRVVLAHVNRMDADAQGPARPWGSVFTRNLARAGWEIKRAEPDGDDLVMGAYLRKRNDGRRNVEPWGLRFAWSDDGTTVTVSDESMADADPALVAKQTAWQRMVAVLRTGPKTVEAVASATDLDVKSARRTLERYRLRGAAVNVPDSNPLLWALAARRQA